MQHCFSVLLLSFYLIESQERFSDNLGLSFLWGVFTLSASHWLCLEKVGPNIMTMMPICPWPYILEVGDPCVRIPQIILVFRKKFGWNYEQKRQTKAEAACKFYIMKPSIILQAGHKFFIILTQNFYDWKSESAIIMYVHDLYLVVGKTTTMKGIWWEVSSDSSYLCFPPQILIQYNVLKRSVFHHLPWSGVSRGVFWYCGMFENTRVVF